MGYLLSAQTSACFSPTVHSKDFRSLAADLGLIPNIIEVDGSSLFCEIVVP